MNLLTHAIWYEASNDILQPLQVQHYANWTNAQFICEQNNANLTSIHSDQENSFVAGIADSVK